MAGSESDEDMAEQSLIEEEKAIHDAGQYRDYLIPMTTTNNSNSGLEVTPSPGGGERIRCLECRAKVASTPNYPRTAADIKHRETCSHYAAPDAKPVTVTAAQAEAIRQGGASHCGLTDDEIAEAAAAGKISRDDAMNRDY